MVLKNGILKFMVQSYEKRGKSTVRVFESMDLRFWEKTEMQCFYNYGMSKGIHILIKRCEKGAGSATAWAISEYFIINEIVIFVIDLDRQKGKTWAERQLMGIRETVADGGENGRG
jgi:hypothetical protein